jgi:hypothetical protein
MKLPTNWQFRLALFIAILTLFAMRGLSLKRQQLPKLDKSSPYFKDISELIHFTEEEAFILRSAIESIDENNLLKQNLKKKLYTVYNYNILAETIVSGKNGRNVGQLVQAIENKKRVVLKNYSSAHGNDIRDREVEAYAFTTNYVQVWCYCPEENIKQTFQNIKNRQCGDTARSMAIRGKPPNRAILMYSA